MGCVPFLSSVLFLILREGAADIGDFSGLSDGAGFTSTVTPIITHTITPPAGTFTTTPNPQTCATFTCPAGKHVANPLQHCHRGFWKKLVPTQLIKSCDALQCCVAANWKPPTCQKFSCPQGTKQKNPAYVCQPSALVKPIGKILPPHTLPICDVVQCCIPDPLYTPPTCSTFKCPPNTVAKAATTSCQPQFFVGLAMNIPSKCTQLKCCDPMPTSVTCKSYTCAPGTVMRDPNQICLPKFFVSSGPSTPADCDQMQCCMAPPSRLYQPQLATKNGNRRESRSIRGTSPQKLVYNMPMQLSLVCGLLGMMSCFCFGVKAAAWRRQSRTRSSFKRVLFADVPEEHAEDEFD